MKKILSVILVVVMFCSTFAGLQIFPSAKSLPAKAQSEENIKAESLEKADDIITPEDIEKDLPEKPSEPELPEVEDVPPPEQTQEIEIIPDEGADVSYPSIVLPISGMCGENVSYFYNIATGELTIDGSGAMYDYESAKSPFYNQQDITKITINGSITKIGAYAFQNCTAIEQVTIPDSTKTIGGYSFRGCENLNKVIIPASVEEMGYGVFCDCPKLKTAGGTGSGCNMEFGWKTALPENAFFGSDLTLISLPTTIKTIGEFAFYHCEGLEEIAIPNGTEKICERAFQYCYNLQKVIIPKNVKELGDAFFGCSKLKTAGATGSACNIEFGWETEIPEKAFHGCELEQVTIPNSIKTIGGYSFRGCKLEQVTIPNGIKTIGEYAFYNCENLNKVIIPASVEEMGYCVFGNCPKLKTAGATGSGCDIEFGWKTSIPDRAFSTCLSLEQVTIPNGIKIIGTSSFYNCENLNKAIIPASVEESGDWFFLGCSKLKTAGAIGSGCNIEFGWKTSIPDKVFNDCSSLEQITIPNGIKTIGAYAFEYCENLNKVIISGSVEEVGNYVFYACNNLKTLGPIGSNSNIEIGWVDEIPAEAMWICFSLESVIIPDTVKKIGNSAFRNCTSLKSVYIPKSVTYIGDWCFFYCPALSKLIVEGSPTFGMNATLGLNLETAGPIGSGCDFEFGWKTTVPDEAFDNWTNLKSVELPDTIVTIGEGAFNACESLEDINFPNSLTTIGVSAFNSCESLKRIKLPASVRFIGNYAFSDCLSIETAGPIGSGCDYEFAWTRLLPQNAFWGLKNLKSVIFPEGLEIIGDAAFSYCESLTGKIEVPETVDYIGHYAFDNCISLSKVVIKGLFTQCGDSIFYRCDCLKSAGPIGSGCDLEYAWNECIPEDAFSEMHYLEKIILPEGIEEIGSDAFLNCNSLTTMEIPETVDFIDTGAFDNCISLSKVVMKGIFTQCGGPIFSGCNSLKSAGPIGSGCDLEYSAIYDGGNDIWEVPDIFSDMKLENVYIQEGTDSLSNSFDLTEIENLYLPNSLNWIYYCPSVEFDIKINHLYYYGTKNEFDTSLGISYVKKVWGNDLKIHYLDKKTQPYPSISQSDIQIRTYDYRTELSKYGDVEQLRQVLEIALKNGERTIYISDIMNMPSNLRALGFIKGYINEYLKEAATKRELYSFWIEESKNGKITALGLYYAFDSYFEGVEGVELSKEAQSVVNTLLRGLKNNSALTEQNKALLVHDRLIRYLEYDYDAGNSKESSQYIKASDIESVLLNRKAVCMGYARTYYYLLEELGITADIIVSVDLNHAWNCVFVGGTAYHVDCTWDDLGGTYVSHKNFLCSDAGILKTGHNSTDFYACNSNIKYGSLRNTKYDNYAWQNIYSEIQLNNNVLYYEDENGTLRNLYDVQHTHSFKAVVVAPTATKVGYTAYKCSICGQYKKNAKGSVIKTAFKAPTGKPSGFKCASRTATSEKFTWNKTAGVSGYQIQLLNSAGKSAGIKALTGNAHTFAKLAAGHAYKARVRFYIKAADGKNYYGAWATINSLTLPKATNVSLTAAKKAFTAKWGKIAGVTGYQLQYATNNKFTGAKTVTIKKVGTLKYTVKNLTAKKTYYVRVRTYKTMAGANYFSTWSAIKAVKTK